MELDAEKTCLLKENKFAETEAFKYFLNFKAKYNLKHIVQELKGVDVEKYFKQINDVKNKTDTLFIHHLGFIIREQNVGARLMLLIIQKQAEIFKKDKQTQIF